MEWIEIILGGLSVMATVSTFFGLGYLLGKDHNNALVDFLKENKKALEDTEKRLREEAEVLKLELQKSHAPQLTKGSEFKVSSEGADRETEITGSEPEAARARKENRFKSEIVSVPRGKMAKVFEGDILITVQRISFEGSPLRHLVYATVGAFGKPTIELQAVDLGYVMQYHGFEVRVIEVDTFYAKFLVTQLDTSTNPI